MRFFPQRSGPRRRQDQNSRPARPRQLLLPTAGVALTLLLALLGGASRNDLGVQPLVQLGAIIIGAAVLIHASPIVARVTPLAWALAALAALMALQLVPLHPELWRAMPGRQLEANISDAVGLAGIWRPLSVVPDHTVSALLGIVVPAAVLVVFMRTPQHLLGYLMWLVAAIGVAQLMLGLGQLATVEGALFFYPRTSGTVTGLFHNRNHLAIFLGTLPPVFTYLALGQRDDLDRREPMWAGLVLAIALAAFGIVLTGSRIGVAVFVLATAGGALMVWRTEPRTRARVSRPLTRRTRIVAMTGSALGCATLLGLVLARSDTSLTRLGSTDLSAEGRVSVLRPLLDLIWRYFPTGSGFGTFDRVFRIIEPEDKLRLSFLNHAHNDFIEILIEGGLVSAILVILMAIIAVRAAIAAWRQRSPFDPGRDLARTGSIVALGLLLGSVSDYPMRTPMLAGWMTLALSLLLGRPGPGPSSQAAKAGAAARLDVKEALV